MFPYSIKIKIDQEYSEKKITTLLITKEKDDIDIKERKKKS